MNRICMVVIICLLSVSTASGWQGRLQALGNPVGLVTDESDFLVHPSFIRNVEDLTLFTSFAFSYLDIPNYDFDAMGAYNRDNPRWAPGYGGNIQSDSGVLVPLGAGVLGAMFSFDHDWSFQEGNLVGYAYDFSLDDMSTGFMLSILYGLDMSQACGVGLRVDLGINKRWTNNQYTVPGVQIVRIQNNILDGFLDIPGDSGYGEARFTLSTDGTVDSMSYAISGYGGFLFAGYMDTDYRADFSSGEYYYYDADGDYNGFIAGGDIWIAYQASDDISVPFTFSVDYSYHHSTTSEPVEPYSGGGGAWLADYFEFDYQMPSLDIAAGIGVDARLADDFRLGGGFTYSYFSQGTMMETDQQVGANHFPGSDDSYEFGHIFAFNANGEYAIADGVDILAGLNLYYKLMYTDVYFAEGIMGDESDLSMNGYAMGLNGSLGLSVEYDGLVLEPFVAMGFETRHQSGEREILGSADADVEFAYDEWFVTTGISIAFDGF